jgi:hypothetical protein
MTGWRCEDKYNQKTYRGTLFKLFLKTEATPAEHLVDVAD